MCSEGKPAETSFSKKQKAFAALLSTAMIVGVLLCTLYIAKEAHHDCTGADCPICACMRQCINNFKQLGFALLIPQMAVTAAVCIVMLILRYEAILPYSTLVLQKVRLDE